MTFKEAQHEWLTGESGILRRESWPKMWAVSYGACGFNIVNKRTLATIQQGGPHRDEDIYATDWVVERRKPKVKK